MLQLCLLGTHQCYLPKHREKTKQNETQHYCAIGCDPVSYKSSVEGKSYLKNSKARCGFALRYLSPYRKTLQCAGSCSRQLAVGTDCNMSPPAQQLQGSLTPGMSMHTQCAAPHSRLGLHVRLLGAGLPWPLLCPFPQDDVRLGTDLVKLVPGVAFGLLPSASGPPSLACIKLHKSQGCCQFPLVRKGQMEARVTTFMFLSGREWMRPPQRGERPVLCRGGPWRQMCLCGRHGICGLFYSLAQLAL